MADQDWAVGDFVWNGTPIYDGTGAKVTTGTAPIEYVSVDSDNNTVYLQDDLTTWSTTPNSIDLPYVAAQGAHAHKIQVAGSFRGRQGFWRITDPVSGFQETKTFEVKGATTTLEIKDGTAP